MRYAVIPKEKALGAGIAVAGHYDFGDCIAVNERELMKESKVLDLIRKHKEKNNGK